MIINFRNIFISIFFFVSPFVDGLTGFMLSNGMLSEGSLFSPSQLFRLFLTIFSFYFLKSSEALLVLTITVLLLILELSSFWLHQNFTGFLLSMVYAYKLIFVLLVFIILRKSVSDNMILLRYFVIGSFLYALILVVTVVLGVGESTYAQGAGGSKGFFASGNGLSVFLGVSSILAYYYYIQNKSRTKLVYYLVILVGTGLVGTKASIFFILLNFGVFLYYNRRGLYFLGIAIVLLFFVFFDQLVSVFNVLFEVIVFRYSASSSLASFLASGRDVYIRNAFEVFNSSGLHSIRSIIGSGIFLSFRDYHDLSLPYDTLESDLFDVFFSYGAIGVLSYLLVILVGMYVSLRKSQYLLFVVWCSLCSYSLIAGHMLFNSMSNIAFLILFILILQSPRFSNEKKYNRLSST
ncbi:hypothetical protein [Algoriphagus jejuensis]|uniref:hypothetical protein n=1 Tax=Algoriphagus jejuensis TaxID=419934 RepID=UPI0031D7169C